MYFFLNKCGFLQKGIIKILLGGIICYQKLVSPLFLDTCRFYPTCSDFTKQSLREYGIFKGILLSTARVIRCNHLSSGGVDLLK